MKVTDTVDSGNLWSPEPLEPERALALAEFSAKMDAIMSDETIHYFDRIARLAELIPEEVLAGLPADFAANLDHYLYGSPKQA